MQSILEKWFSLSLYKTTPRIEITAGLTTFLTMAYIIFINPVILSYAGLPESSAFTATCCSAIIGCALLAFLANYPIAIAPGMGLNVYFTYVTVLTLGFTWQQGLACVLIAGIIFFFMTVTRVRQGILNAIPHSISMATAAGIGLFIGVIALKNAGIIVANKNTLMQLGSIASAPVLLCFLGFFLIAILDHYRIPGAILISIISISIIALLFKQTTYYGILDIPPSVGPSFFAFQFHGLFTKPGIAIIFTFVIVALFDSSGTLIGLLHDIKPMFTPEEKKRIGHALMADSVATIGGAMMGTSTTSPFIESAAGVRAGGRTGLTALTVAILFILALFFSPLAKMIPPFATAPAMLFISCMMLKHMAHLDWQDLSESIPAAITMMMIPFTFSIADGIGLGFISYTIIKALTGKWKSLNPTLLILSILFVIYFFTDVSTLCTK